MVAHALQISTYVIVVLCMIDFIGVEVDLGVDCVQTGCYENVLLATEDERVFCGDLSIL
jgi:hypothetical protein